LHAAAEFREASANQRNAVVARREVHGSMTGVEGELRRLGAHGHYERAEQREAAEQPLRDAPAERGDDRGRISADRQCASSYRRFGRPLILRLRTTGYSEEFEAEQPTTEVTMSVNLSAGPVVALIAGILILIVPRLLNYIVALYLIVIGLIGIFGVPSLHA